MCGACTAGTPPSFHLAIGSIVVISPPHGAVRGPRACAAFAMWRSMSNGRPKPPMISLLAGTGVWVLHHSGEPIPAHVSHFNAIAGCYYVIPDADPMKPMFVAADRIVPRYVGEVGPGMMRAYP